MFQNPFTVDHNEVCGSLVESLGSTLGRTSELLKFFYYFVGPVCLTGYDAQIGLYFQGDTYSVLG